MISIKGGTQTFSDSVQTSSLKADAQNNISAGDKEKFFGDKNLGDILNKVADPNWVNPKARKVGPKGEMDKDAFMKLFLAQLKNQDPTQPRDSHELAAQLAQFTSLEKLNNINDNISKMAGAQNPKNNFDALQFIGKQVSGDSSKILRVEETESHDVRYKLPKDATEVVATVKDARGQEVRKLTFADVKSGKNEFSWNGKNEDGRSVPKGEYKIVLEAKDNSGKKIFAETKFEGKISGVNFTPSGPLLLIGNQKVHMSDISKIVNPAINSQGASAHQKTSPVKNKVQATSVTGATESQTKAAPQGLMNDIGMSREMINKITKLAGQ